MNEQPSGDRGGSGPRDDDLASRFLALAVARTPTGRGDWSRAMLAELDQVTGRGARWRFALGAARAALVPPRSSRLAAIVLAVGAAAAGLVIHVLLPGTGPVAAVAVPGLPALCAWAALARPYPLRQASAAGRAAQVVAIGAITACPVLALREIALYPGTPGGGAVPYARPVMTVMFAAELAAYLLLVLLRPGLLGTGRHSGLPGLAAALTVGWVLVLNQPRGGQSDNPVMTPAVTEIAIGALLVAGALAVLPGLIRRSGIGQSLRSGAGEVMWGVLLSGPAAFIAVLLTTSHSAIAAEASEPVFINEAHQQGATSVLSWIANDDLGGAVVLFTAASVIIALTFAITHALFLDTGEPPERLRAAVGPPEA